jgi:intein/homing endonuclease
MDLTTKNSTQVQFKIGSPLTFRKEGTSIGHGDELTLISVGDKSLVYPIDEDLMDDLKLTMKDKSVSEGWLFKDKEVEINMARAGECQKTFDLIKAGNIGYQSINTESYLNTFRILKLGIREIGEQKGEIFKFGDIIYVSKLDHRGKRNLMFVETNHSSLKNKALF